MVIQKRLSCEWITEDPQLSRRDRSMSAETTQRISKTLCATTEVIPSWQMLCCKSSDLEDSISLI